MPAASTQLLKPEVQGKVLIAFLMFSRTQVILWPLGIYSQLLLLVWASLPPPDHGELLNHLILPWLFL